MKPVAMVGWSGAGEVEDLERSVARKLASRGREVGRIDDAIIVRSDDPVAVARKLSLLPGVSWIAVGYRFSGNESFLENLGLLAKKYLSKGKTFRISAKVVGSRQTAGDAVLAGNSALLSSIAGVRVDERRPRVRFRVCVDGTRGACGAEIGTGPGGVPTSGDWVACLVSGGERSSSMAWMAALSGFSVRLVHSRTDDRALTQVARLYSELSHRMDPRCVELVVLQGGKGTFARIGGWLDGHKETAFAGSRPSRSSFAADFARRFPNLALPLLLVQDEAIGSTFRSLGLGRTYKPAGVERFSLEALEGRGSYSEVRFGGVEADPNAVIDAVNRGG